MKEVIYEEYKGHPLIKLYIKTFQDKDEYLTLGLRKCKVILSHIQEIKDFVNQYGGSDG